MNNQQVVMVEFATMVRIEMNRFLPTHHRTKFGAKL